MGRFPRNVGRPCQGRPKWPGKKVFVRETRSLKMLFPSGQFTWNLEITRELMYSSILLTDTNWKIFRKMGHLPSKTDFLRCVLVGVLLSAYRQTDKFSSQSDYFVLLSEPRMCLCLVTFCIWVTILEIFYAECTKNLLSWLCLQFYTVLCIPCHTAS